MDAVVCSDALARGIDVGMVDFVVNYDCPAFARTYVHRAGRTARAGREGSVITLCEKGEVRKLKRLLEEAGKREGDVEEIQVGEEELDGVMYGEAAEKTREVLDGEKKAKKRRNK